MRSLVLHIGDPKTGSTSIQEVLRFGQWTSAAITAEYTPELNSFPLANPLWDAKQAAQRTPRFTRLAEQLAASKADVAIISAEQFARVNPVALMTALQEFLPDLADTAVVVAYVRPHVSRLISAYMQRTKSGLFQGQIEALFTASQKEPLLEYTPRFERWRAVFGDRFILRPMIRSQLQDGDVVADFLHIALQGQPFQFLGGDHANTSLSVETLAGLRVVQTVLKKAEVPAGPRNLIGDHVGRTLASTRRPGETRIRVSRALYQDVATYCRADAAAMDASFFGAPIMTEALIAAEAEAVPEPQISAARAYYQAETIAVLQGHARELSAQIKMHHGVWVQAFERRIGQRPGPEIPENLPPKAKDHIRAANAILAEVAALVAGFHGAVPVGVRTAPVKGLRLTLS